MWRYDRAGRCPVGTCPPVRSVHRHDRQRPIVSRRMRTMRSVLAFFTPLPLRDFGVCLRIRGLLVLLCQHGIITEIMPFGISDRYYIVP